MLLDFDSLPKESSIWIYPASRPFSDVELVSVREGIETFLSQWSAHGKDLHAGYEIRYKRFVVIALDQSVQAATGCAIDRSVELIKQLEQAYQIDLLDRMNVSFKQGEFIAYKPLSAFRIMAKQKAVSKNTIVFNHLVTNIAEYREYWEIPASESWHNRFF